MKVPKIESLMILAFFGVVAVWAISKCSAQRTNFERNSRFAEDDQEDRPTKKDSLKPAPQNPGLTPETPVNTPKSGVLPPPPPPSSGSSLPKSPGQLTSAAPKSGAASPANNPNTQSASNSYTTLYVTLDGLKLRKSPSLHSDLIDKLKLYEPVSFLNKKSDKQEEISLGTEKVTDYWFKVRTKSGKEGWVFGAGVAFYKTKRKGSAE